MLIKPFKNSLIFQSNAALLRNSVYGTRQYEISSIFPLIRMGARFSALETVFKAGK